MNPITSATPTMWAALSRLRNHGKVEEHDERCRTLDAWERRGYVARVDFDGWCAYAITETGCAVIDALRLGRRCADGGKA